MVILEHDHGREIHAMGISASDQHAVLFDQTESGSGLAGTCNHTLEAILLLHETKTVSLRGNATAASHHVERSPLSDQDLTDGSVHMGTGLDGLQDLAFLDMPFDAERGAEGQYQTTNRSVIQASKAIQTLFGERGREEEEEGGE